jgi:hypothetical protein
MIKDILLVCSLILIFVLIYRIYFVSQKINNLEEKFIILDNFSQTLFNYISTSNNQQKQDEQKQNEQKLAEQTKANVITYSNTNNNESESDEESDTESNEKVEHLENVDKNQVESTENFDTKDILSDMVSQLKESIIQNNKETLSNELKEVDELKESLKENDTDSVSKNNLDVFNSPSDVKPIETDVETTHVTKKKEEDLQTMTVPELKELAKKQNVTVTNGKKQKTKTDLIKDLLASQ